MDTFTTINPFTQQAISEYPILSNSDLTTKLERSKVAFDSWKKTSFATRAQVMMKVAILLRRDKQLYATLITNEMGKIINESLAEVEKCAIALEYYAKHSESLLGSISVPSSAKHQSYISFSPMGMVFAIMPWNYPFWQVIRFAAPYLMSGNVSSFKHAPNTLGCGVALERLFLEAGIPEGVFQHFIIDIDQVEHVIAHDAVQGVTFTGSERAGASVAALAGKYIKKSVLELGGSDPFIVLGDADLSLAAQVAVQSRMMNAGQACICAKRFIVVEKVVDTFLSLVVEAVKHIKVGNPLDPTIHMGPMARLDLAKRIESQTKESLRSGARMLIGGERNQCFYLPSVMDKVNPSMTVFREEVFGPVASVVIAPDDSSAVTLANESIYGLASSIWSKDVEKATYWASELNAGSVFINALVHSDPRLPFGGIKKSGYGRELGEYGLKEFSNVKTIFVD